MGGNGNDNMVVMAIMAVMVNDGSGGDGPVISGGLMIERKAVNVVQVCESSVVLEGISFNRSDSIVVHPSAENERIDGCIRE